MTVLEAHQNLMGYFVDNDYFEYPQDIRKLTLVYDTDAVEMAYLAALETMEKNQVVVHKEKEGRSYWILQIPFKLQKKNLEISVLASMKINEILHAFELKKDLNEEVSEEDINNLISIILNLTQSKKEV